MTHPYKQVQSVPSSVQFHKKYNLCSFNYNQILAGLKILIRICCGFFCNSYVQSENRYYFRFCEPLYKNSYGKFEL